MPIEFAIVPTLAAKEVSTLITIRDRDIRVVIDSGFFGTSGYGWPPEWLDIQRGRINRRATDVAQVSKTSTVFARGNFRLWNYKRFVGYVPDGMRNRHGFTNPGIGADFGKLQQFCRRMSNPIISVSGWSEEEITALYMHVNALDCLAVEFNISCKNVPLFGIEQAVHLVVLFKKYCRHPVIAKIGAENCVELAEALDDKIDFLNLINTLPMSDVLPQTPLPYGVEWMISGSPIKQRALEAVSQVVAAGQFKNRLIGGGGILSTTDAYDFLYAGANALKIMSGLRFDHYLQENVENAVANFDRCPDPLKGLSLTSRKLP